MIPRNILNLLYLNPKPPIMKAITTFFLLAFLVSQVNAQFNATPVGTIPGVVGTYGPLYIAYVDHDDPKFVHYDKIDYVVTMYNIDLSQFRQFTLPLAYQNGNPHIFHVTTSMFDCDSTNVEYILTYYNGMGTSYAAVIREDGEVLLHLQNAQYSGGIIIESYADLKNTGIVNYGGHAYLSLALVSENNYEIYQLCDELPRQYSRIGAEGSGITTVEDDELDANGMKLFPVPSAGELRLVIATGKMKQDGEARINDLKGSLIQNVKLPAGTTEYQFDISSLTQGIYLMSVTDGTGFKASRKFVKW